LLSLHKFLKGAMLLKEFEVVPGYL